MIAGIRAQRNVPTFSDFLYMTKYFLLVCLLSVKLCWSQSPPRVDDFRISESLVVHCNTDLLLSGESLTFKIYCLNNTKGGALSDFSKIAYVELVGENGSSLVQLKAKLQNGQGDGEYIFDSATPSGNYTLVVYTRWMRNFGIEGFFRKTISLINPQALPAIGKSTIHRDQNSIHNADNLLRVSAEKDQYQSREKVSLQLTPVDDGRINYSMNVRMLSESNTGVHFSEENASEKANSKIQTLPDARGELLTGVITEKASGKPLTKTLVTLSSPSTRFDFIISRTDSTGRYYFNIPDLGSNDILIKPLNESALDYTITMESGFLPDAGQFAPLPLVVDSVQINALGKRYLSSQIESVFSETRRDSLRAEKPNWLFLSSHKDYPLDAYTRFPTMDDVFREIIPEVIVKRADGKYMLNIRNIVTSERFYKTPLLLIDGVPVTTDIVMTYNQALIRNITVVPVRYFYGGLESEGIVSIETFNGIAENVSTTDFFQVNYSAPLPSKVFQFPNYHGGKDHRRIPDYRTQLYWNPQLILKGPGKVEFFTGDIIGKYLVEVVGVKEDGTQIHCQTTFTVN